MPVIEAKLIVVAGHANRGEVTVTLPTVIGRSREADLTIAHPMVSRQHCQVFEVDGLLMVRDLDSLNGTMFRGQRIREAPLRPGDEFTIGPLTFRVQYEYQGDLDAVPAPEFAPLEDQPAAAPANEALDSSWADELTPCDPQAIAVPIEGAAREFAPPQSAEQAEQEKEEEEQPEPTPPPNLAQKPEKRPPIRTSEKNAAAEIKPVEKPDRRQAGDEDSDDPLGWLRE